MKHVLVVGAGFAGAVMAERIASQLEKNVVLIDQREHIGGNAFDAFDAHGVLTHRYGPHFFHTNSEDIWNYLSQFTKWRPYEVKALSLVNGEKWPFPVNLKTYQKLIGAAATEEQFSAYMELMTKAFQKPVGCYNNSEEVTLARVGTTFYEMFFKNYTQKQWGVSASKLAPSICGRIPVRYNDDDRYFTDKYQAVPLAGYTELFNSLLDNKRIELRLATKFRDIKEEFDLIVYTGAIDEYFGYCYGPLPWRSGDIRFEHFPEEYKLDRGYVALHYPNEEKFYRVTEHKQGTGQKIEGTTLCYEYPLPWREGLERLYPVSSKESKELYNRYVELSHKTPGVIFTGRLGKFSYYDMDQTVAASLTEFKKLK